MTADITTLRNTKFIMKEVDWLKDLIRTRMAIWNPASAEKRPAAATVPLKQHTPPSTESIKGAYPTFISDFELIPEERVALVLALTPHITPQVLDPFFTRNASYNRPFTEFGGIQAETHKGFLPTWETLFFIVAGNDLSYRLELEKYFFHEKPRLFNSGILDKPTLNKDEPLGAAPLRLTVRFLQLAVLENTSYIPSFGHQFPAELYFPKQEWEDLILSQRTKEAIEEIKHWIEHSNTIFQSERAQKILQPGFRALFYGPPGTGKSLAAGLIGKTTRRLVFRVDLSQVVSKYIGETEKNLANIFDQAQFNEWILFFDEADALFGKRVKTSDAKDRYANQETAYLLQRIEHFPGTIILASNQIGNLDKAFARRFQAVIHFPKPGLTERRELWQNTFKGFNFAEAYASPQNQQSLWRQLAESHQVTGAHIQNILRRSLLAAHASNNGLLGKDIIESALRDEIDKERRL